MQHLPRLRSLILCPAALALLVCLSACQQDTSPKTAEAPQKKVSRASKGERDRHEAKRPADADEKADKKNEHDGEADKDDALLAAADEEPSDDTHQKGVSHKKVGTREDTESDEESHSGDDSDAKPRHQNRLARETSPYLLLHAENPVDWYPWCPEAFEKARAEQKLIFLSIGYSSCYWCHVMERESFMDEEVAAYLNEHFVCVKVDREERPDLDEIYMTALQIYFSAIGSPQGGGWPMTMFLTAEGKPVMGGTYFPPRDRDDATGLLTVLNLMEETWSKDPARIEAAGVQLASYVKANLEQRPLAMAGMPGQRSLDAIQDGLSEQFDPEFGGFGFSAANPRRPKFPEPANLLFLISRVSRLSDPTARDMLLKTLTHICRGGIRDHLGGGMHRYSTDRYWKIPHFEKMLYDQGQLATVLAEAYAISKNEEYRQTLDGLASFVLRVLVDKEQGGFYAAMDAETDGKEGAYYAWTTEEVDEVLGPDEAPLFRAAYGLDDAPNFEEEYVLLIPTPLDALARGKSISPLELDRRLANDRAKLLARRQERPRPLIDTKILTGWNGMMIRGLADAGRIVAEPEYLDAAIRAAEFALHELRADGGRLWHGYCQGEAKLDAYLDDYALLVDGLIGLHKATRDVRWLEAADELTALQVELFWDDERGGFFFTSKDHEELLARSKTVADSALPSGNAVSVSNLVYLSEALDRRTYLDLAEQTVLAFAQTIAELPTAVPRMGVAIGELLDAQARRERMREEAASSR